MKDMNRRQFLRYGMGGMATLVVGAKLPWLPGGEAFGQATAVRELNFTITDGIKEMITHNPGNPAECYFWFFKEASLPAEVPGPVVVAAAGETIRLTLTNALDEPHGFAVQGTEIRLASPLSPGETRTLEFPAPRPGAYLYLDPENEPVNRMMGLHGALIVMPPVGAQRSRRNLGRLTPYGGGTPAVLKLFNHLGGSAHFPGLAWEEGDANPQSLAPAFRQYVWVLHEASPNLFREVGSLPAGQVYSAEDFRNAFLRDPFSPNPNNNRLPQYFTINGQSGALSHMSHFITPHLRVGEPCVVRVLNAGLMIHSLHIHANHVYVISINGRIQANPLWVDTFPAYPLDRWDWLVPFTRPPDVPNERGIGMPDPGLVTGGHTTWPPEDELNLSLPSGDLSVGMNLQCYPMHDHSEPSQTAQGGNYNMGMMAGFNLTGDRTLPGGIRTFHGPVAAFGPNAPGVYVPSGEM